MSILLLVGIVVWSVIVVKHGQEVRKFGGHLRYKHVKAIKKMVSEGKSWEDIELYVTMAIPAHIFGTISRENILAKVNAYWKLNKPN